MLILVPDFLTLRVLLNIFMAETDAMTIEHSAHYGYCFTSLQTIRRPRMGDPIQSAYLCFHELWLKRIKNQKVLINLIN